MNFSLKFVLTTFPVEKTQTAPSPSLATPRRNTLEKFSRLQNVIANSPIISPWLHQPQKSYKPTYVHVCTVAPAYALATIVKKFRKPGISSSKLFYHSICHDEGLGKNLPPPRLPSTILAVQYTFIHSWLIALHRFKHLLDATQRFQGAAHRCLSRRSIARPETFPFFSSSTGCARR